MRRCLNCMEEYSDQYESCPHCGFLYGADWNDGINLPPGTILQGRYIVGTVIKVRETDVFYIGWDALFERKVEIQEYFPKYCAARSGRIQLSVYDSKQDLFKAGQELFVRHSRQMIRLYKEEDVITYHACFAENGTAYAVMDYRNYQTLGQYLEGQKLRARDAKEWIFKAAGAVEKVHGIGIYHGYVGPDSFWVCPGEKLILKDLGGARYISGKPGIVDYGRAGFGTDVYGLAKMFCQLMIGEEIEEEEKLESECSRLQAFLKKTDGEALKAALRHETNTVGRFCMGLQGERYGSTGKSRKKRYEKSLNVPPLVKICSLLLLAAIVGFTGLVATGTVQMKFTQGQSRVEEGKVRVRNVTGKDADDMEKKLERDGLKMSRDKMEYSKDIPQNRISYQSPKEGSQVPKGTVIEVWISMGPKKAVIPPVVGQSMDDARNLLNEAGFTNIKIEKSQKEGAYGKVLDINREQGSNVEVDQEIILMVCINEDSGDPNHQGKVPLVTNMDQEEAQRLLKEEGFRVNRAKEYSDQPEGMVLAQDPESGKMANKGSYVTIRVSVGLEQKYMSNLKLMTREEAEAAITAMGLKVGQVTEEYSDSVAEGKIISQGIDQDAPVKQGDEVALVVSKGAKPAEETKRQEEEARRRAEEEARRQEAESASSEGQASSEAQVPPEAASSEAQVPPETASSEAQGSSEAVLVESWTQSDMPTVPQDGDHMPKEPVETGRAPGQGTEELYQDNKRVGPGAENM